MQRLAAWIRYEDWLDIRSLWDQSASALAEKVTLMPSRTRSPNAVPFTCPTCGKATSANRRTGLLNGHKRPGRSRQLCPASSTAVMRPGRGVSAAPSGSSSPDAVVICCPECRRDTRANRRTGRLYSHQLPNTTELCPGSATDVLPPEGGEAPQGLRRLEKAESPGASRSRTRLRMASTSVRTVRGGLPGLGKRH